MMLMLIGLLILQVAIVTTAFTSQRLDACPGNDIQFRCLPFSAVKVKDVEVKWEYKTPVKWEKIAQIVKSDTNTTVQMFTNRTHRQGRLILQRNGSLEIKSLHKDKDGGLYRCRVTDGNRQLHLVELNLTCNGSEITRRQVCIEKDIVLDCKPNSKVNSPPIGSVTWRKKLTDKSGLRWSRIVQTNTTMIHDNGSLWIRGGRYEGKKMYRCEFDIGRRGKSRHVTEVKDVVCADNISRSEVSTHNMTVCVGDHMTLFCPALNNVKVTNVRLIEWRTRGNVSTKRWKHVGWSNTVINKTLESGNKLHVTLNGSLNIKSTKKIHGTEFECIVKTLDNQTMRNIIHIMPCNHANLSTNTTRWSAVTTQQPYPRNETQQLSLLTHQQHPRNTTQTEQSNKLRLSADVSQNTSFRIVETSTKSVIKPSIKEDHTIILTTVTTLVTNVHTQRATGKEEVMSDERVSRSKTVCGGKLTPASGEFYSPHYPNPYPANTYCKWTIRVPKDFAAIQITLENMNLEFEDKCLNDFVGFYDELGNQVGSRICGAGSFPITVRIHGRIADVTFQSDHSVEKTGFKLAYRGIL